MPATQINVDHCQACGNTDLGPDDGHSDCCNEPVILGVDDCAERCYHSVNIVAEAVAALRLFRPTQEQARQILLPMWAHFDKLTEAQRREILGHFDSTAR